MIAAGEQVTARSGRRALRRSRRVLPGHLGRTRAPRPVAAGKRDARRKRWRPWSSSSRMRRESAVDRLFATSAAATARPHGCWWQNGRAGDRDHRFARAARVCAGVRPDPGGNPLYVLGDWLTNDLPDDVIRCCFRDRKLRAHAGSGGRFSPKPRRVLRPGGRLVICAWLAADAPRRWQERWLLEPICREGRMPQLGTRRRLRAPRGSRRF